MIIALTTALLALTPGPRPSPSLPLLKLRGGAKEPEDKIGVLTVPRTGAFVTAAVLVSSVTAANIITPGFLESKGASAAAIGAATWVQGMRKVHPLAMTIAHAVISKSCADVVAQAIPSTESGNADIDVLRVFRSMLACILSISIPFYYWTKIVHATFSAFKASQPEGSFFTSGFGANLLKTGSTQLIFRPIDVGLYLTLQSIFRGDTARQLVTLLQTRYVTTLIGGLVFYTFSNFIMFTIPIPFLHPIFGSVLGSMFSVWLAIQAYSSAQVAEKKR